MGKESSDVRFDLGPLIQGQTRTAKFKSPYNSYYWSERCPEGNVKEVLLIFLNILRRVSVVIVSVFSMHITQKINIGSYFTQGGVYLGLGPPYTSFTLHVE